MGKKGVLKKAKKLELKETQKNKINYDRLPALEEILRDVYATCHPKPIDYFNRKDLVRIFNAIAKEIYGNCDDIPVVEEFGSFLMDIFSAKSDLDLSVNFNDNSGDFPQKKKIQSLRKFAKKFYVLQRMGHVSSVQPILTAKVPILKIVDQGTGIECDISIENRDGILKSKIVRMISSIDERFQMLCFLMKAWAKTHGINSSKERTLNSLSIISLVAFHLQTRDPPVLPPFSAIFKDGIDPAPVEKMVNSLSEFGKMNKESLGELFVTLLAKLASVETLWPKGLCASIYEGAWIYKTWDSTSKNKLDSKFGFISVEDFTDRSLNVARVVGKKQVQKIYKVIHVSIYYISAFMEGGIEGTKLRKLLFGRECVSAADSCISLDRAVTKRTRTTRDSWETERSISSPRTKIVRWGGPPTEGWGGEPKPIRMAQIEPKPVQSTVVWGGTPAEGWAAFPEPIWAKGMQCADGRGQWPVVWGGTPVEGWVQQAAFPEPIWAKGMQCADGRGQWPVLFR